MCRVTVVSSKPGCMERGAGPYVKEPLQRKRLNQSGTGNKVRDAPVFEPCPFALRNWARRAAAGRLAALSGPSTTAECDNNGRSSRQCNQARLCSCPAPAPNTCAPQTHARREEVVQMTRGHACFFFFVARRFNSSQYVQQKFCNLLCTVGRSKEDGLP